MRNSVYKEHIVETILIEVGITQDITILGREGQVQNTIVNTMNAVILNWEASPRYTKKKKEGAPY